MTLHIFQQLFFLFYLTLTWIIAALLGTYVKCTRQSKDTVMLTERNLFGSLCSCRRSVIMMTHDFEMVRTRRLKLSFCETTSTWCNCLNFL